MLQGLLVGTVFVLWSVATAWAAFRRPRVATLLPSALFGVMGSINLVIGSLAPHAYVDLYGDRSWLPFYRTAVHGFFAAHATAFVLAVAVAQLAAAAAVWSRGRLRAAALLGMVAFLLAVTPAGPENAVNLVYALGAVQLLRRPVLLTPSPPASDRDGAAPDGAGRQPWSVR